MVEYPFVAGVIVAFAICRLAIRISTPLPDSRATHGESAPAGKLRHNPEYQRCYQEIDSQIQLTPKSGSRLPRPEWHRNRAAHERLQ
jgi:hypothetical protein